MSALKEKTLSNNNWLLLNVSIPSDEVLESYDDLVIDQYAPNSQRYRRFSQYKASYSNKNWEFEKLPHRPFIQSPKYNSVAGGIKRKFEPLEADFSASIREVMVKMSPDINEQYQLDVHQYRVYASKENEGCSVPEGPHQDGHEIVGITVFRRYMITGGETILYTKDHEEITRKALDHGDTILLQDDKVFHDATSIVGTSEEAGFRDYLVLNINLWENRRYGSSFEKEALL